MGQHTGARAGLAPLRWAAGLLLALLVGGLLVHDALAPDPVGHDAAAPGGPTASAAPAPLEPQRVVPGTLILRAPRPTRTPDPEPVVEPPRLGTVTTAVANLPNRTADGPFAGSMRTLLSSAPDFVMLNEVSRHGTAELRALAPGYDAYREEQRDDELGGGSQSMNNVVLWRAGDWTLLDAGRVKLVDDDRGFRLGQPFTWDRYATWVTLRQADGAVVSVVSTHLMTNPARYPRQHGNPRMTRAQQYGAGMDVLVGTVRDLAALGPVLVGGDMNTHGREGPWTAEARMSAAGYGHAKDSAVMYVFYPSGVGLVSHRQVRVASDHPAIVTTLDLSGAGDT